MTRTRIALTVVFGLLFLWSLWGWRRAEPGSAAAFYAGNHVLLNAAFLLMLVPRLIWPADSGMVLLGGLFAVVPFTIAVVAHLRRRRTPRDPDPPA